MGAYSELDAALREGGDFVDDDAFIEDDGPCATPSGSTGNVLPVEPASVSAAQPVEPQPAALAQSADEKLGNGAQGQADEDAKRKAHEEAEAKRKAEFDARQVAKKAAEQEQLDKLESMSEEELLTASIQRVSADTEKLTRRNMKECVAEHIQTLCLSDTAFARNVMHPRKSMIHCIWYINRKAREFVEQEMKDNDFPKENGIYGSDVPNDLCYQWAVDYFNDPNAKEDEEKEEKFVPQPYRSTGTASSKKSASSKGKSKGKDAKKKDEDTAKPRAKEKAKGDSEGQMSLLGVA